MISPDAGQQENLGIDPAAIVVRQAGGHLALLAAASRPAA
jgi:hypothetical protein